MTRLPILYLIVPCYNEEAVLDETNLRLVNLMINLMNTECVDRNSKILYVDDGSVDQTWNMICRFHDDKNISGGLKLAGNSGHQNALMAGLSVAKEYADIMISIDADLQDDIRAIPIMVEKYGLGNDIVYGVRKARATDSWFKRNTALTFYKVMHLLGVKSVYNHADYRLMSKRAVSQLCNYRERNLFLRGIVPLIGYKTDCVYYDRLERKAGESKYPLKKMVNFAIDGITSFSVKPVRMVFLLGMIFLFIAFGILGYVLYEYLRGNVVPGWSSLILSLWFIGGCVLMSLGIVGEYIGKIYIEVKNRPLYNIESLVL